MTCYRRMSGTLRFKCGNGAFALLLSCPISHLRLAPGTGKVGKATEPGVWADGDQVQWLNSNTWPPLQHAHRRSPCSPHVGKGAPHSCLSYMDQRSMQGQGRWEPCDLEIGCHLCFLHAYNETDNKRLFCMVIFSSLV